LRFAPDSPLEGDGFELSVPRGILADPDLYARDRARFEATCSAFAAAREELTAAEEQWLALEMRREEIEGPGSSG
jgi:ATP-binding cassette subfamily F protein uup